jgi:formylglycine-generating enzyme required for sulfatase activity
VIEEEANAMQRTTVAVAIVLLAIALPVGAGTLKCPPDSVKVGVTCIDTYEASVWQIAPSETALVKKVQSGKVTLADLTKGGATQLAPAGTCGLPIDYGLNFPGTGNWTPVLGSKPPSPGVYAVAIPGVLPSACITWFQANQACALSGKRLVRNDEWQRAAAGTPDPGTDNGTTDCNISSGNPANTGSRSSCKSSWGAFDMVGNVEEWVADWADRNDTGCTNSADGFGFAGPDDRICLGGDGVLQAPGALIRGGNWFDGAKAGVFAVFSFNGPGNSFFTIGFRCAR